MSLKASLGILVFIGVGSGVVFLIVHHSMTSDPGHYIPMVVGKTPRGTYELQMPVNFRMSKIDPPRLHPQVGKVMWKDWVAEHFDLRDDTNQKIQMKKTDWGTLMPADTGGTPDFYLAATVLPNVPYTLDYLPYGIGSEPYRYEFTVPAEGLPFKRPMFEHFRPPGP